MTEVLTYETLKADRDAQQKRADALAVENAALINSSACTLQDGRPQHGFYASEWFIAKLKNGQYAALKALPEEYSHDYRTNDGTYYTSDWVVGWMQTPDTEYKPNVKTPATDAALAAIEARFCGLLDTYGKVEPERFNPEFADLYAKIVNRIFSSVMDNPSVTDLESLTDWLENSAENARAYADMSMKFHAQLREAK